MIQPSQSPPQGSQPPPHPILFNSNKIGGHNSTARTDDDQPVPPHQTNDAHSDSVLASFDSGEATSNNVQQTVMLPSPALHHISAALKKLEETLVSSTGLNGLNKLQPAVQQQQQQSLASAGSVANIANSITNLIETLILLSTNYDLCYCAAQDSLDNQIRSTLAHVARRLNDQQQRRTTNPQAAAAAAAADSSVLKLLHTAYRTWLRLRLKAFHCARNIQRKPVLMTVGSTGGTVSGQTAVVPLKDQRQYRSFVNTLFRGSAELQLWLKSMTIKDDLTTIPTTESIGILTSSNAVIVPIHKDCVLALVEILSIWHSISDLTLPSMTETTAPAFSAIASGTGGTCGGSSCSSSSLASISTPAAIMLSHTRHPRNSAARLISPLASAKFRELQNRVTNLWKRVETFLHHDFLQPLGAVHNLSSQWLDYLSGCLSLYLYFMLMILAKEDTLIETAKILGPFLPQVAWLLHESTIPVSSSSSSSSTSSSTQKSSVPLPAGTTTRPSASGVFANRKITSSASATPLNRCRSASECSFNAISPKTRSTTQIGWASICAPELLQSIVFTKKKIATEARPPAGHGLERAAETVAASNFSLISDTAVKSIQNVFASLPIHNKPLCLWALLAIVEAAPTVQQQFKQMTNNAGPECDNWEIDWLCQLANEGSSVIESRFEPGVFRWDVEDPSPGGTSVGQSVKESHSRRAASVWRAISLRLGSSGALTPKKPPGSQEEKWAVLVTSLTGDWLLHSVLEMGFPIALLDADRPNSCVMEHRDISPTSLMSLTEYSTAWRSGLVLSGLQQTKASVAVLLDSMEQWSASSKASAVQAETAARSLEQLEIRSQMTEKQLVNLVEGPIARHSNQIRSFMDRFDSMGTELRRSIGMSATQTAAITNQISELKRQIEENRNGLIKSGDEPTTEINADVSTVVKQEMVKTGLTTVRASTIDQTELALEKINKLENQLNELKLRSDEKSETKNLENLLAEQVKELKDNFERTAEEFRVGQVNALSDALQHLDGLSESVREILRQNNHSTPNESLIQAALDKVEELYFSGKLEQRNPAENDTRSPDAIVVESGQRSLQQLEEQLNDLELALTEKETKLTERLEAVEKEILKYEDALDEQHNGNELFEASHHLRESIRVELESALLNFKKKIKHDYIGQIINRLDRLDDLLLVSADDAGHQTANQQQQQQQQSNHSSSEWSNKNHPHRMDGGVRAVVVVDDGGPGVSPKGMARLQWDMNNFQRNVEAMLSANAGALDSLHMEVQTLRRDQREIDNSLKEFRVQSVLTETIIQDIREERQKAMLKIDRLENAQTLLAERVAGIEVLLERTLLWSGGIDSNEFYDIGRSHSARQLRHTEDDEVEVDGRTSADGEALEESSSIGSSSSSARLRPRNFAGLAASGGRNVLRNDIQSSSQPQPPPILTEKIKKSSNALKLFKHRRQTAGLIRSTAIGGRNISNRHRRTILDPDGMLFGWTIGRGHIPTTGPSSAAVGRHGEDSSIKPRSICEMSGPSTVNVGCGTNDELTAVSKDMLLSCGSKSGVINRRPAFSSRRQMGGTTSYSSTALFSACMITRCHPN